MPSLCELTFILFVESVIWCSAVHSYKFKVKVFNDGPATLDSTITFTAKLEPDPPAEDRFIYNFEDTLGNEFTSTSGAIAVWNRSYSYEEMRGHSTPYRLTTKVVVKGGIFHFEVVAKGKTEFLLTDTINGNLTISGLDPGTDIVATNTTINVTANIYDPSGFYANADIDYAWSINDFESYGIEKTVSYNVSKEGPVIINAAVHARVPINNHTGYLNKWGFLKKVIKALSPVNNITVSGNVYLKQGEILVLDMTCNGTGPYSYCFRLIPPDKPVPVLKNMTCDPVTYSQCAFHLQHYFPHTGKYTIATLIGNKLGLKLTAINIEIYDVTKKPQLSTVIVPISCSLMALVIIVVGLAYHVHQRRSYIIEVADFDFQQPVTLSKKTFLERVKESFKVAYAGCSRTELEQEGSPIESSMEEENKEDISGGGNSRSQLLPTNYGSIP